MRKTLFVLSMFTASLLLASVALGQPGKPAPKKAPPPEPIQKITFNMASAFPKGMILGDVAEKFKERVEAKSKGNIRVNLFLGGAMGSEEDIIMAVTAGAVESQAGGTMPINMYAPPFMFIETPFIMRGWSHIEAVWQSPLGERMRASVEAAGNTTLVGPIYRGPRHFTSRRPVVTPKDVKGIKLRLPILPTWVAVWSEIGASTVPIPLGELYTALATGVADASEGDLSQIQGFKLHEVQSHLSLTGHLYSIGFLSFNTKWLRGLNGATRNMVLAAADEAIVWGTKTMMAREDAIVKELAKAGMTVVQADQESFAKAGAPAIDRLFRTQFRVTNVKEVMSFAK